MTMESALIDLPRATLVKCLEQRAIWAALIDLSHALAQHCRPSNSHITSFIVDIPVHTFHNVDNTLYPHKAKLKLIKLDEYFLICMANCKPTITLNGRTPF